MCLKAIFGRAHGVLIGVVHLLPLPGSPDHRGPEVEPIYDRALDDARAYAGAGVVTLSKRRREAGLLCGTSSGRDDLAPRGHRRGA